MNKNGALLIGDNVEVITINGYHMTGKLAAVETEYIVLRKDDRNFIVYKHAISTLFKI